MFGEARGLAPFPGAERRGGGVVPPTAAHSDGAGGRGVALPRALAEPLYLGLCTDTRFFQNDSIGVSAFETAARLLRTGLDPATVLRRLNSKTMADLKTLGLGLGKLQFALGGRLVWLALTQSDLRAAGAKMNHVWSSGLIGFTSSLEGSTMGLVMIEGEDGKTYCEFRGREGFDVSVIALHFGGGGHRAASGCSLAVPFAEAVPKVVGFVEQHITRLGANG